MKEQIPTLDFNLFTSDKNQFVKSLGEGYEQYGFCSVVNHGIDQSLIKNTYRVFKEFFKLPEAVKIKYHKSGIGGARGYTPFGVEVAKDSNHPDLKEFWHVGRELSTDHSKYSTMYPNVWVNEVPEFKEHALKLYHALDNLGNKMLGAIALYLGLPQSYFDDKTDVGNSILRPIHYPAIRTKTKSVRSGQHEDINLITLLVGSNEAGLEILSKDRNWIPVTTKDNEIVVNIGDMLQRFTNNKLPSTTHRVVNTPESSEMPRFSIPYFLHPNSDFFIKTLESCITEDKPNLYPEPITADNYLKERLIEIGLLEG